VKTPEEAWIRIGRPTLTRVLAAAGFVIGLAVMTIPDDRQLERHPIVAIALPIALVLAAAPIVRSATRDRGRRLACAIGAIAGVLRGLAEIENMDGRADCIPPPHPAIGPVLLAAACFAVAGAGAGWLGLGAIAREARAREARDLHLLPATLADQSRWLAAAALVACARQGFVAAACIGVASVVLLVAFLVVTTRRDTFAAAVLAGCAPGWIAEESHGRVFLSVLRPIGPLYRCVEIPHPVAVVRRVGIRAI
jgi:hypothetical protein